LAVCHPGPPPEGAIQGCMARKQAGQEKSLGGPEGVYDPWGSDLAVCGA